MHDIKEIFQKNNVIFTKHGNQGNWIQSAIMSFNPNGNVLNIPLKQEYISKLLVKGEDIEIKIETEEYLFIAKGIVKDILIDVPQRIIIVIDSVEEFGNKREDSRYICNYNCIIKGENFDDIGFGVVCDISKSGVGIISRHDFNIGSTIFFDILINGLNILKLSSIIIRKNINAANIEYGLKIQPINNEHERILSNVLECLYKRENYSTLVEEK